MGLASNVLYFARHPNELRAIVQWKLQHRPLHPRNETQESPTVRICFKFLDESGRSFSPVIKELHPELRLAVCVFYLILRGLDTIEDDTSLPLATKEPLLRSFKDVLDKDGWTFTGNRPEEKDREVLVQFHNVITEYKNLKPAYQAIIKDSTATMGNGMAEFATQAAAGDTSINTVDEYDLYCWYVAGILGESLTRLFVEAQLSDPSLIANPHLYKSMGLLLQKNNIIRDVREDHDDGRCFWPREIWSKHVENFEDLFQQNNIDAAIHCSSEMVLNALGHVVDCLEYLSGLREQSVFNFCAIPQCMALATLELLFRNPDVFRRNVKIKKGDAIRLMVESGRGLDSVCGVFCRYVRRIRKRNDEKDPSFLEIEHVCEQIERFAEKLAPQSVKLALAQDEGQVQQQVGFNAGRMFAVSAAVSILAVGAVWFIRTRS